MLVNDKTDESEQLRKQKREVDAPQLFLWKQGFAKSCLFIDIEYTYDL